MDIRGGTFNTTIVTCVTDKYREHPGGARRQHVERGIAQVPDAVTRSVSHLLQGEKDRSRARFIG